MAEATEAGDPGGKMTHVVGHFGRRTPGDWEHVEKYPLSAVLPQTVTRAEKALSYPKAWREFYDQGREGACVGFSSSQAMSVLNRKRYDARWLWNEAKAIDEWEDTKPGDDRGTSVRAAMDILRDKGHRHIQGTKAHDPTPEHGIQENRWATTIDELRTSIQNGVPVVMGTNWYERFNRPVQRDKEWFIDTKDWRKTKPISGHAFMFNVVSDRRQAFRTPNSWGLDYPQVWFPYEIVAELIRQDGEATLITDRL